MRVAQTGQSRIDIKRIDITEHSGRDQSKAAKQSKAELQNYVILSLVLLLSFQKQIHTPEARKQDAQVTNRRERK